MRAATCSQTAVGFAANVFQSTRPCGPRRPMKQSPDNGRDRVSIHAAVRAATLLGLLLNGGVDVSIHAAVRAATPEAVALARSTNCFNPRGRAGRDENASFRCGLRQWFQSTRPCGPRLPPTLHARWFPKFQSTRPCGPRPADAAASRPTWHARFNPRGRAGRDSCGKRCLQQLCCFNPRGRAGRDAESSALDCTPASVSIHAAVRAATIPAAADAHPPIAFQSTRPCGPRRARRKAARRHRTFQSTRPCGPRRLDFRATRIRRACVSIHAAVRAATPAGAGRNRSTTVSIHAAVRAATAARRSMRHCRRSFNPRGRAGRDLSHRAETSAWHPGFNPRGRAGRDAELSRLMMLARRVSIHAAVRAATTVACSRLDALDQVSIHAAVRAATSVLSGDVEPAQMFQSTRPCGPRRGRQAIVTVPDRCVSIHAAVRAATSTPPGCCRGHDRFNPRGRAGRDAVSATDPYAIHRRCFNPRGRAGRDLMQRDAPSARRSSFNPRGRAGRDAVRPVAEARRQQVSIHAAVRAATRLQSTACHTAVNCFNPRGRAGRDASHRHQACRQSICFNPRGRAGRDVVRRSATSGPPRFQSTRPCGPRLAADVRSFGCDDVSIHAAVRAATSLSCRPFACRLDVSIHAAVRAATRTPSKPSAPRVRFQSTRPCGPRPPAAAMHVRPVHVSIHAAVRAATHPARASLSSCSMFQSTRPCGPRPSDGETVRSTAKCFNPRGRAGRDAVSLTLLLTQSKTR